MKRAVAISLLLGSLAGVAAAQSGGVDTVQNLRRCLDDGIGACDPSLLTESQAREIAAIQHDRNLWTCLMGYGKCDHSTPADLEAKDVAAAEHRRNLLACETALGICNKSLLTPSEVEKVTKSGKTKTV